MPPIPAELTALPPVPGWLIAGAVIGVYLILLWDLVSTRLGL